MHIGSTMTGYARTHQVIPLNLGRRGDVPALRLGQGDERRRHGPGKHVHGYERYFGLVAEIAYTDGTTENQYVSFNGGLRGLAVCIGRHRAGQARQDGQRHHGAQPMTTTPTKHISRTSASCSNRRRPTATTARATPSRRDGRQRQKRRERVLHGLPASQELYHARRRKARWVRRATTCRRIRWPG